MSELKPDTSKWQLTIGRTLVGVALFCVASVFAGVAIARVTATFRDPFWMAYDQFWFVPGVILLGASIGCFVGYKWIFTGAFGGCTYLCYLFQTLARHTLKVSR